MIKTKFKISSDVLRIIAILTMLIDHIAAVILSPYVNWMDPNAYRISVTYQVMRMIGRIAFPIFVFQIVEGVAKTHNRKRYTLQIFLTAILAEVPFDLAIKGQVTWQPNNVLWTLLFGMLVIWGMEAWKGKILSDAGYETTFSVQFLQEKNLKLLERLALIAGRLVLIFAGCALADACHTDYGMNGILLMALLYLLWNQRLVACILGYLSFAWEPACLPAFVLFYFYNGKRTFKGKGWKIFGYLFYPVHLLILYMILQMLR